MPEQELIMGPEPVFGHHTPGLHIWGWTSNTELQWLCDTAAQMESVVEVGSLRGRSANALLTGCPGPVYCIDPWEEPGDHAYRNFIAANGHFPNVHAIRGWSPQAAEDVPGQVDMTFIDADHEYESVVADIDAWLPKTRRLICGHDYSDNGGYEGVKRAVRERFGERAVLPPLTSIWTVWL